MRSIGGSLIQDTRCGVKHRERLRAKLGVERRSGMEADT
jgi:hypothetical protein